MILNGQKISSSLNRVIEWSLYILIFSLPLSKTMIEICAIVAITAWVFKKSLSGRQGLKLVHTDLNSPLLIFYLISFLSIFWSTHPDISIRAFIRKLSEYLLLFFIVAETVNEKRVASNMILALAASAFIVCIDSIYQRLMGADLIRGYKMFGLGFVSIGGIRFDFKGFDSITLCPPGELWRITGPFKFPNGLSAWLLMVSFPFISLALLYPVKKNFSNWVYKKSLRLKIASSILAVLLVCSIFLTYTRGASISFILALVLLFLLIGGRVFHTIFIILILAIAIFMSILPEEVKTHMGLSNLFSYGTSTWHRLRMWMTAWRMFIDRPFLGQGLNTFMANYARFRGPLEEGIWYAHNCYLQMAAEIGIFGLLSFLWMVARMVTVSVKSWRLIEDEFLRYLYLGLFCGIVSFVIHIGVSMSLYSFQLAVLFYFLLGVLMGIKNIGLSKRLNPNN